MKKIRVLVCILFFLQFVNCRNINSEIKNEIEIIDQVFLTVVDSNLYYPLPTQINEQLQLEKSNDLNIGLYPYLISINQWEKDINIILNEPAYKNKYGEILKHLSFDSSKYDIRLLRSIGNYKLSEENNKYARKVNNRAGLIQFSRISFDKNRRFAILLVVFKDNIKSDKVNLFLLDKMDTNWVVKHNINIEMS